MLQDMWNAPPGFRPSKSAPSSPAKPLGMVPRTRSETFHVAHKVPIGDTPYVRAKNVQVNSFLPGFFFLFFSLFITTIYEVLALLGLFNVSSVECCSFVGFVCSVGE